MQKMSDEDQTWLRNYVAKVEQEFCSRLGADRDRFPSYNKLLRKFREAASRLLERGWPSLSAFDEMHNELCVADGILAKGSDSYCIRLEYEPPLLSCKQSIDFRATMTDERSTHYDVKTIHPVTKDDWQKFETARDKNHFPDHVNVHLEKEGLGGELWHNMFTARSKMLEYALELEAKIKNCGITREEAVCILVLCSNRFDWHLDQLEDFVAFYRSGKHSWDDEFARMEKYDMESKNIRLSGTIDEFVYVERLPIAVKPRRIIRLVPTP